MISSLLVLLPILCLLSRFNWSKSSLLSLLGQFFRLSICNCQHLIQYHLSSSSSCPLPLHFLHISVCITLFFRFLLNFRLISLFMCIEADLVCVLAMTVKRNVFDCRSGVERWGRGGGPPRVTPSEGVTPKPKKK